MFLSFSFSSKFSLSSYFLVCYCCCCCHRFLLSMNQPEKALDVLRKMYEINTGTIKEVSLSILFFDQVYIPMNIIYHSGISSLLFDSRDECKKFDGNQRIFEHVETSVESNKANLYPTIFRQYGQALFHGFHAICNWSWYGNVATRFLDSAPQ